MKEKITKILNEIEKKWYKLEDSERFEGADAIPFEILLEEVEKVLNKPSHNIECRNRK